MSGITPAPVTEIATVTGNVNGNVVGNVVGSVGSVGGNVSGSVGSVAGAIGSLAAQAKLDVNAECDIAVKDGLPTQGEGTGTTLISIVTSASLGVKGAWVQAIGSTAFDAKSYIVSVVEASPDQCVVDLGVGPGGSEVVEVPDVGVEHTTDQGVDIYSGPFNIPSGSRVAFRAANLSQAAARTLKLSFTPTG